MVSSLIQRFKAHANNSSYPWLFRHNGGRHNFHIVLSALIHGNETGSLPSIIEAIENLKNGSLQYGGLISFTLGNPEAAYKNQRFLESDLNRMFVDTPIDTHEYKRALQLRTIFDQGDILLDFHQTILPSQQPFYIFPWTNISATWARALSLTTAGIDATPPAGPITTRCADDYVSLQNKPAITIEMGEKGIHQEAKELCTNAIQQVIRIAEACAHGTKLESLAAPKPKITLYKTIHREPYHTPQYRLREGLINFLPVKKGEALHKTGTPDIHAPSDGMLLFPKYPLFSQEGAKRAKWLDCIEY